MSDALVTADALAARLRDDPPVLFDCRFDLLEPGAGRAAWRAGHVPGAVHADLDRDLAGPVTATSGRHPLPAADAFARFLAGAGWSPGRDIVAYDAQGGAFAARLWWLMRYFGHDCVRLLDGGWPAWLASGLPVAEGETDPVPATPVTLAPDAAQVLDAGQVVAGLEAGTLVLLDARDAERYAGRTETIDPVAGHVPGARNRPFARSLSSDGRFAEAGDLRADFEARLEGAAPGDVVHMCGSGVTACHNLFAMERAGLPGSRLYPGSWSEWIRDPSRPVASGD